MARENEYELSDEDRRALRGSKFAPLPSLPSTSRHQSRLAHPGGPLTTNKAAALAKFLERKLQDPNGLASINPQLIELAVKNAKETVSASANSNSVRTVRHVASFGDSEDTFDEPNFESSMSNKHNKKKKNKNKKKSKKNKKFKGRDDSGRAFKKAKKS